MGLPPRYVLLGCGSGGALGVDEIGEPPHLALDRLDRVTSQLAEIAVVAARGVRGPVETLLQPGPASLEDAEPDGGVGAGEEREPHVEVVVLPRGRAAVGDLLAEELLPGRRQLV